MKLFLKRDKTRDDALFVVFDELCREKFFVTKPRGTIYLIDRLGNRAAKIKQLPLPALRAYSITAGNRNIKFIINSKPTASNCYFYGISWRVRGSIFSKSFDIIDSDNSVAATHEKRFSDMGEGYELNVYGEYSEELCIAVAVCVDLTATVDNLKPVRV